MRSKILSLGAAMLLASAASAWAQDEQPEDPDLIGKDAVPGGFSGTIGFTNEYLFRGISQTTDGVPAVQGSLDYSHDSGIYLGVWGSNVKFADASIEMDFYGGWNGEFNGVKIGLGGIYYYYPGAADALNYDYFEFAPSVGYDFGPVNAKVSYFYSPDYFAASGDGHYVSGDVGVPIWKSLSLLGHVGHQSIETNALFGTPDYTDYSVGFGAVILGFNTSLKWSDTDLTRAECFGGSSFCNSAVILSIGRSL
ncbi:MAG TPA: TorF family putative porin [Alphaproteobacteria bacterium]|jgi:uncharacterized protein (TIGR02001 family)|nr:TorF family putative porin [Alphaproteobacteria bacterium]